MQPLLDSRKQSYTYNFESIVTLPYMRKFWQTTQVKAIGEEKLGKLATVSALPDTFSMYL